ncbi:MAG: archaemetzincin family Zn-dependent metalloprotease [Acidilobus sp.]
MPVGAADHRDVMYLADEMPRRFPVKLMTYPTMWALQPPLTAYDWSRMQYRADLVNSWLRGALFKALEGGLLALGIVSADGYVGGLNFVFGLASQDLGVATVYTRRLLADASTELYRLRLLKEAMHEVGHLLGLAHCDNPTCVMSFSNSLGGVDRKEARFCDRCSLSLRTRFKD